MYICHLPDYPSLKKLFNEAGYTLDVELSNEIVIEKDGEWVEYYDLSPDLQLALDRFAEDNNLN